MLLRYISLSLYTFAFAVVLLTDGGVYPLSLSLAVSAMAVATISAAWDRGVPDTTRGVFNLALLLWIALALWIYLQTIPLPGGWLGKPAWSVLAEAGLSVTPTISVVPGDALYCLLPISLAFMTFLSTLLLFRTDREAERALQILGLVGGVFAVFAIIQTAFFPNALMFGPKQTYIGSLTAPFVNRNTAATFYGVILLVLIGCWALATLRRDVGADGRLSSRLYDRWTFAVLAAVTLVAVAMTQSRGGAAATLVGCIVLIASLVFHFRAYAPRRRRSSVAALSPAGKLGLIVLTAALLLAVGAFVFGRSMIRVERQGLDDSRLCVTRSILPAVADNWGTGLGPASFRYYFPAYRDSICGLEGAWYRAHDFYIETAWSLGTVVAIAAFAVAYGAFSRSFATGLRKRRSRRPLVWVGICSVVTVSIHSAIDFSLQIPGVTLIFACVIAVTVCISYNKDHSGRGN